MSGGGAPKRSRKGPGASGPATPAARAAAPAGFGTWYREPVALGLVLVVLTRVAMWLVLPNATEDAYITFRYARNLVAGHGLVFNPGERVMGFTSPLWTLWCALGIALVHDPLIWTRVWSLAADLMTLTLVVGMLARHASRAAAWCFAVAFGSWPFFAALGSSGMESSALVALCVLGGWAVERRHPAAGVILGALALTRPEGALAAVALAWRSGWRDRGVALAIAAAGFAALAAYYGSAMPNSALAKAMVYGIPGPIAARHWWEWIVPFEIGNWPQPMETVELFQARLLLGPAAVLGLMALWRTPLAGLSLAGLLVWAFLALTGAPYFYWYAALPVATTFLLASAGMSRILRGRAVYVALALFFAGTWTLQPHRVYGTRSSVEHHLFALTAEQLQRTARPGDTVFLEPIGFVGWENPDLRIHDEIGLVTPAVARGRRQAGWYADYVRREHPTWLVARYGLWTSGVSFAGIGQPFRSDEERRQTFAAYTETAQTSPKMDDNELVVLRANDSTGVAGR